MLPPLGSRTRTWKTFLSAAASWLGAGGGSLKEKTVRGGIWVLLGGAANRLAGLAKLAVLGRLLSPRDFGLLGVALLVQQWIESFTQTGVQAALIQKREDIRLDLDPAWSLQLLRAILVSALVLLAAPLGGRFFQNTDAIPVVRTVSLLTLLYGFTNPAVVYLRKELDFRRDVAWRLTGAIAGLAVAIPLAFLLRNAWALAISVIVARAGETLASYLIHPYRPRWQFGWTRIRDLMRFGKWIFWLNVVGFFSLYIDGLAVGRFLGTTALGYYQVAQQIAVIPLVSASSQLQGLLFPAFSKLLRQQDLRRAFVAVLRLSATTVVPLGCFVMVFAQPLVHVMLGPKWIGICPILPFLAWVGIARALRGVTGPLVMGIGQPKWLTFGTLLDLLVVATLVYPLLAGWGTPGVAAAVAAAAAVSLCFQLTITCWLLQIPWRELAGAFQPAAVGSVSFLLLPLVSALAPPAGVYLPAAAALAVYSIVVLHAAWSQFRPRPSPAPGRERQNHD
jgi:O-antigen/teichoic acid export membrane protein